MEGTSPFPWELCTLLSGDACLSLFHTEFEGIEVYSKKVFNTYKPKTDIQKTDEDENQLVGPMVRIK